MVDTFYSDENVLTREDNEDEKNMLKSHIKALYYSSHTNIPKGKGATVFLLKIVKSQLVNLNDKLLGVKFLWENFDQKLLVQLIEEGKLDRKSEKNLYDAVKNSCSSFGQKEKSFTFSFFSFLNERQKIKKYGYGPASSRERLEFFMRQLLSVDPKKTYHFNFDVFDKKEPPSANLVLRIFTETVDRSFEQLESKPFFLAQEVSKKTNVPEELFVPILIRAQKRSIKKSYYIPPIVISNLEDMYEKYPQHFKSSDLKFLTRETKKAKYFDKLDPEEQASFVLSIARDNPSLLEALSEKIDEKIIVKAYATLFDRMIKTPNCRAIWQKNVLRDRISDTISDKPVDKNRRKI